MRTAGLQLDQAPELAVPLRFFLTAPLFGTAAGVLLAVRGSALLATPWHPHTIALAHLLTLGTLTMAMLGALYQILPVVVGVDVRGASRSAPLHAAFTAGVAALVTGLLAGDAPWARPVLWAALVLLACTLVPLLGLLGEALLRHRGPGGTVPLLRLAVVALAGTVALGLVFASGHGLGWWPLPRAAALPVHVFWSLGGWVGGLIAGVGMAALPMFYIAPPFSRRTIGGILWALAAMLVAAPVAMAWGDAPGWLGLPLALGAAALAVFTAGVVRMQRVRRRKVPDVSLRHWQGALGLAWLALAMAALRAVDPHPRWALAFGALYLVGFAGSVLNGMLYKIVPFLVWMHRFSRLAGQGTVPLMAELLPRVRAQRQMVAHFAAVGLLGAAALWPAEPLVRLAGIALAVSQVWLWLNLLGAVRFRPAAAAAPTPVAPDAARGGD